MRGREALTHAGNFFFFRVCCSLRGVTWKGNDTTRLQANQGTHPHLEAQFYGDMTDRAREASKTHLAGLSPDFLSWAGGNCPLRSDGDAARRGSEEEEELLGFI